MLHHAERHRLFLAVAQLDLERLVQPLVAAVGLEIRLLAFADEVEGVARRHAHRLVARRVVNAVFAGELQLPVVAAAIEPQLARGQCDAEMIRLCVHELAHDDDLLVALRAVAAVVVQPAVKAVAHARRAVIDVDDRRFHALGADELHLLLLAVAQRRGPRNRVEMKFVEGFFGDGGSFHGIHRHRLHHVAASPHQPVLRLNLVHVARHQLDLRVAERRPAVVVHRDPAEYVHIVTLLRRDEVVVRLPRESARDVAHLGVELRRFRRLQQPVERGLENCVVAQTRKQRLPRQTELQLAVHLDNGLLRAAAGHEAAADDLAGNQLACRRVVLHAHVLEINRLALVQREQQFLRDGVVAVILLQDLHHAFASSVAQDDRIRLDVRRRAREPHLVHARLEVERHGIADDREVLVVDGERRLRQRRERGRRAESEEGRECFHNSFGWLLEITHN